MCLMSTVETRIKEPTFFLGSLDGFLSNGLVFSSPACKVLSKVSIYQFFLNSGHCKKQLRTFVLYSA